jgi:hypothetical protein
LADGLSLHLVGVQQAQPRVEVLLRARQWAIRRAVRPLITDTISYERSSSAWLSLSGILLKIRHFIINQERRKHKRDQGSLCFSSIIDAQSSIFSSACFNSSMTKIA